MPVWRIVTKQESERVSRVLGGLVGGLTAGCWNTIERSWVWLPVRSISSGY